MISYAKLWVLLESKRMKKTDLTKNKVISPATLAKLGKNELINVSVIEKLCAYLKCQPGDIMEYISEETLDKMTQQIDNSAKVMLDALKQQGIPLEQFTEMLLQQLPSYLKDVSEGKTPSQEALHTELEQQNNDTSK